VRVSEDCGRSNSSFQGSKVQTALTARHVPLKQIPELQPGVTGQSLLVVYFGEADDTSACSETEANMHGEWKHTQSESHMPACDHFHCSPLLLLCRHSSVLKRQPRLSTSTCRSLQAEISSVR
jgi:hypothetical protein